MTCCIRLRIRHKCAHVYDAVVPTAVHDEPPIGLGNLAEPALVRHQISCLGVVEQRPSWDEEAEARLIPSLEARIGIDLQAAEGGVAIGADDHIAVKDSPVLQLDVSGLSVELVDDRA